MSESNNKEFGSGISRTWSAKFAGAFRGLSLGVHRQNSFAVHLPVAVAVVILAGCLRLPLVEWALLLLCVTLVIAAELFNSALETLAKAIDRQYNPLLADGLDIASAAVLISAMGSVLIGLLILGSRLLGLWVR